MTHSIIKMAAIQMVSGSDFDANVLSSTRLIELAAKDGAKLVLLPENFLCFNAKLYADLAQSIELFIKHFSTLAKQLNIDLILGSVPLDYRRDGTRLASKLRSACLCIDSNGSLLARYDKRHLFDVDVSDAQGSYRESNEFEAGEWISVVNLSGLSVGLSICYDLRFPGHYQKLRDQGANVLVVPAAFTAVTGEAHWEVLLRARAIENQCYVVAANQGGQHSPNRATWGRSMIIDPWGKVITSAELGEGYCLADYDQDLITKIRRDIPVVAHRDKSERNLSD